MKKICLIFLSIFLLLTLTSCKKDTLVVFTEAGFPPFEYEKNGKIVGVDVEIMKEVGKKLGKKVEFRNVSFETIVDAVKDRKLTNVGAAGLSVTEERLAKVDFSKVYYQANLYVIYKKDKNIIFDTMTDGNTGVYWKNLRTNRAIGVQTGTTADLFLGDETKKGGSLEGVATTYYKSIDIAVNAIGSKVDYVVIDELPAKKLVSKNDNLECLPLYYEGTEGSNDILAYDEYAICVTKGQTKLLNTINEVLDELLLENNEGVSGIDRLVTKHLGVDFEKVEKSNLFKDIYKVISTKEYRNYLFEGFKNTLIITILAAIIGLLLGFSVAIIEIFAIDNKFLKIPKIICDIYTTVIRGTPIALQLFVMVFAILVFDNFQEIAIILTFGINSGAYVSESIRGGILSVDKGQMEAGRALGLTQFKTMKKIILPQAIKNVIPAIGNELIALVKETAIISIVGSTIGTLTFDLNQATSTINKGIANYLAPAILAGILYLIIVYGITLIIKLLERRFARSDKR